MTSVDEETIISVTFADDTAHLSARLSDFLYHEPASIDIQSPLINSLVNRQHWRYILNNNQQHNTSSQLATKKKKVICL
jgi:hypothetical protein